MLRASYSTIDGTDQTNGADIGTLTPNRFNLDARLKEPEWGAIAGIRLKTASNFDGLEFNTTTRAFNVNDLRSGYVVMDLYGSWEPNFARGFRLDFGIDNVLDKDYERVFSGGQ